MHFAAAAIRAELVNCNVGLAPPELAYVLADSQAHVLVADASLAPAVHQALKQQPPQDAPAVKEVWWIQDDNGDDEAAAPDRLHLPGVLERWYPAGAVPARPTREPHDSPIPSTSVPTPLWTAWPLWTHNAGRAVTGQAPDPSALAKVADVRAAELQSLGRACYDPDDGYHVYYTSGTTGKPKGVLLSHSIVMHHALGTIRGERAATSKSVCAPLAAQQRHA